jgi:sn-glycerol 3-phosphate transport system permease protein
LPVATIYNYINISSTAQPSATISSLKINPSKSPPIYQNARTAFIYYLSQELLSYAEKLLGLRSSNLLGDPATVLSAIIIVLIWKQAGYFMIFFLSGLQNIPREMYEASSIDGASSWKTLRHITWSLLMPTTLFVMIVALTNAFKTVDHLYIMTKGGPDNASTMILYYIYQVAFEFWDTGMASAITTILI